MLHGVNIPNDSFVDIDDVFNIESGSANILSNAQSIDRALLCVTDLQDCCAAPRTVHGNWYFPDGTIVLDTGNDFQSRFQVNRGPNAVIQGQKFYGSVHLFRRYSSAPGRGRFRCELPSAVNPSVNQILYVNICEFISSLDYFGHSN